MLVAGVVVVLEPFDEPLPLFEPLPVEACWLLAGVVLEPLLAGVVVEAAGVDVEPAPFNDKSKFLPLTLTPPKSVFSVTP